MAASYPAALKTFVDPQDFVDVYDDDFIIAINDEVEAIETELGTDVAGSRTNLKDRLAQMIADNGSLLQSATLPSSGTQGGDLYFKTDEDVVYFRNNANSSWLALGQATSNVIFEWHGNTENAGTTNWGRYHGQTLASLGSTWAVNYEYFGVRSTTTRVILRGRFTKISGITEVIAHARTFSDGNTPHVTVDVGGNSDTFNGEATATPAWDNSATIDVSGLSNGTTYDITISLDSSSTTNVYLSDIVLIGQ